MLRKKQNVQHYYKAWIDNKQSSKCHASEKTEHTTLLKVWIDNK